jgi:hypothetical protein
MTVAIDSTRQSWQPPAVPLPPPAGEVIGVSTVAELFAAVDSAQPGTTIEILDGCYVMPTVLTIRTDDVTLRSASGDRDAVVLDGSRSEHNELLAFTECHRVTVADLTIRNVIQNGFKLNANIGRGVQAITLHNCVAHNVWQRGVKGVDGPEAGVPGDLPLRPGKAGRPPQARHFVDDCVIRYCLFHNDRPKRIDDEPYEQKNPQIFDGNYIAAIDAMSARNWRVHDNVFLGIRGRNGGARGAIFFWQGSQNVHIADNTIVDCDSGMWLGLSWTPGDTRRCNGFTVTGNKITRPGRTGILLSRHVGSRVWSNTIYDPFTSADRTPATDIDDGGVLISSGMARCRPLRIGSENDGLLIENNLLVCDEDLHVSATAGRVELRDNLWLQTAWPDPFVNAHVGDLRRTQAGQCLDAGAE